jgi:hypothetical protein
MVPLLITQCSAQHGAVGAAMHAPGAGALVDQQTLFLYSTCGLRTGRDDALAVGRVNRLVVVTMENDGWLSLPPQGSPLAGRPAWRAGRI